MESLSWLLPDLTNAQWVVHALIFVVNITLLFAAKPILNLAEE